MVVLAAVAVVRAEDAALREELTALQAEVAELKALLYGGEVDSSTGLARDRRRLQQDRLRQAIQRANKGSRGNGRRQLATPKDGSDRVPKMTAIEMFESVLASMDDVETTNTTVFGYIGDFTERIGKEEDGTAAAAETTTKVFGYIDDFEVRIGKEEDGTAAADCIVYTSCSADTA